MPPKSYQEGSFVADIVLTERDDSHRLSLTRVESTKTLK